MIVKETEIELKNIMEALETDRSFKTFAKALRSAGFEKILSGETNATVFAPTEKAFEKLPKEKRAALFRSQKELAKILAYHIVPGRLIIKDMLELSSADTVEGDSLSFGPCDGIRVNDAQIIKADLECRNGMVHGIDTVLFPK